MEYWKGWISFDDDGILYNGLPLAQCSDGEKLMVSMGISMALNPTLRVLRIKDGSLLDKTNLAIPTCRHSFRPSFM
jgi:hypothetical protein